MPVNLNSVIRVHNELLQKRLAEIRSQHGDCMIVHADYWDAHQTILTNHKKYQLEEPFKACCGAAGKGAFNFDVDSLCGSAGTPTCKEPNKYINWDGVRLTEAMHQHLADLFFNQGFCKPSFEQLIKKKRLERRVRKLVDFLVAIRITCSSKRVNPKAQ